MMWSVFAFDTHIDPNPYLSPTSFSPYSVITSFLEYLFLCDKINHTNSTLLIKTTYHAFLLLLLLVVVVVVLQALAFVIEAHLCRDWYYWLKNDWDWL